MNLWDRVLAHKDGLPEEAPPESGARASSAASAGPLHSAEASPSRPSSRRFDRPWIPCAPVGEALALWEGGAAFVAFDFETTGLSAETDRIVEIGALRFDRTGPLEEFSLMVDPLVPINPAASAVTGITDDLVRGLEPWTEALPDLLAFLGDSPLMAHNAPFDMSFLNKAAELEGKPKPANLLFDTILIAKAAFPGLPSYKLQELALRFALDAGDAHRALDDAYTCKALFEKCMERLK